MTPRDFDNRDRQKYPGSDEVTHRLRGDSIDSCDSNEPETIEDPSDDEDYVVPNLNSSRDSSPLKRSREEFGPINFETIAVGKQYDVLDSSNRWCEAEVVKIDHEGRRAYVSYIYWSSKFDEWIIDIEGRFAYLHEHTYQEGGDLKVGQRIEVIDEQNKWLEAYVIEANDLQVKIHFKGFHAKFDEWIDRTSKERIRPYGRGKYLFQRKQNAVQWSARPYVLPMDPGATIQHSFELITDYSMAENKENRCNRDSRGQTGSSSRVRYIGADNRERKIANNSTQFIHYQAGLLRQNLQLVTVSGDGNCLFRAVSHQIYGDEEFHGLVRQKCMDYMESEAEFFSQFIVGGKETFHLYLQAKRMNGCWGDDPEIEAMCEIYNRPAEIWAYDGNQGARKLRTFHESVGMTSMRRVPTTSSHSLPTTSLLMRLSYYGGGHYDSIVEDRLIQLPVSKRPGEIEDAAIQRSRNRWLLAHNQLSVESVRQMTDIAATEQAALDVALQESRRLQMRSEYDDLETSLMLSIQDFNFPAPSGFLNGQLSGNSSQYISTKASPSPNEMARLAAQDNILESVQQQSENEYIESVLVSSLVDETKHCGQDEELVLQHAILQSQLEDNGGSVKPMVDQDMQLALELSNLSPDEALQLALKQSIADSSLPAATTRTADPVLSNPTTPIQAQCISEGNTSESMTEEEMLQLALAASLQAPHSNGGNNAGNGVGMFNAGYFVEEEYDEDLMLAIQASLSK